MPEAKPATRTPRKPRASTATLAPVPEQEPDVTAPSAPEAVPSALRGLSVAEHMTYAAREPYAGKWHVRLEGYVAESELAEIRAWLADRTELAEPA